VSPSARRLLQLVTLLQRFLKIFKPVLPVGPALTKGLIAAILQYDFRRLVVFIYMKSVYG
jgi:hypothetical protein